MNKHDNARITSLVKPRDAHWQYQPLISSKAMSYVDRKQDIANFDSKHAGLSLGAEPGFTRGGRGAVCFIALHVHCPNNN